MAENKNYHMAEVQRQNKDMKVTMRLTCVRCVP